MFSLNRVQIVSGHSDCFRTQISMFIKQIYRFFCLTNKFDRHFCFLNKKEGIFCLLHKKDATFCLINRKLLLIKQKCHALLFNIRKLHKI